MLEPTRLTLPLTLALTLLAACASGAQQPPEAEQPPDADQSADPSESSDADAEGDSPQAEADDEAERWLERIEQRSAEIDTLTARVRYERLQGLLGDEQIRFGQLNYDAGPPARFHVHFDRLQVHDELQMQDRRYAFDGRWLAERHDDQKLFVLRELVPEDEQGEDLLGLGEGPFALPLDLRKDTVLERFAVELVEEDEPAFEDAVLLRLTPREHVEIDQSFIEMWYDRESRLPVQVRTVNEQDQTETTIRLGEMETDVPVDDELFDVTPPDEPGWQVERRPLE